MNGTRLDHFHVEPTRADIDAHIEEHGYRATIPTHLPGVSMVDAASQNKSRCELMAAKNPNPPPMGFKSWETFHSYFPISRVQSDRISIIERIENGFVYGVDLIPSNQGQIIKDGTPSWLASYTHIKWMRPLP